MFNMPDNLQSIMIYTAGWITNTQRIILYKHVASWDSIRIFRVGLIFAEFATCLKSPKIDTAKNKPTMRLHCENMTHWKFNTPSKRHFRQNYPTRKIPDVQY